MRSGVGPCAMWIEWVVGPLRASTPFLINFVFFPVCLSNDFDHVRGDASVPRISLQIPRLSDIPEHDTQALGRRRKRKGTL